MNETCANCIYFKVNPKDMRQGFCRRMPPTPLVIAAPQGIAQMCAYPQTMATEWCGEHRAKPLPVEP
jgi:hypothetical protein